MEGEGSIISYMKRYLQVEEKSQMQTATYPNDAVHIMQTFHNPTQFEKVSRKIRPIYQPEFCSDDEISLLCTLLLFTGFNVHRHLNPSLLRVHPFLHLT